MFKIHLLGLTDTVKQPSTSSSQRVTNGGERLTPPQPPPPVQPTTLKSLFGASKPGYQKPAKRQEATRSASAAFRKVSTESNPSAAPQTPRSVSMSPAQLCVETISPSSSQSSTASMVKGTVIQASPSGGSISGGNQAAGAGGGLKDSLSQGMSFFKRRFSSSDLDGEQQQPPLPPQQSPNTGTTSGAATPSRGGPPPSQSARPDPGGLSLQGISKMNSTISAPTSPSKSYPPQAQNQSVYSQVQGLTKNLFQAATGKNPQTYNKEHCKILLIIDDHQTDWSKYVRGKKVMGDWDVRVEQAEFSELQLNSYSDAGCIVDMQVNRGGSIMVRTFRPDFVLVRQPVRNAQKDHRNIIIGLLYGGVPSLNSLHSVYNFCDRPWVFAHLLLIQRRFGKEKFPLIEQAYCPSYHEMGAQQLGQTKAQLVVKVGHAYGGLGKIRANQPGDLQDIASLMALGPYYSTTEPFVESKYDLHLQKIGQNYKAFMRKSISGNWKANQGSAMLEQIAMTDRYKAWLDEVSTLFGGLDICSIEAIVAKDGQESIFEVNDCSFNLIGETQEEDRRQIADLVLTKVSQMLTVRQALSQSQQQQQQQQQQAQPQSQSSSRRESAGASSNLANFIKHESPYHQQKQTQQISPQPPAQPQQPPRQPPPQNMRPPPPAVARPPGPRGQAPPQQFQQAPPPHRAQGPSQLPPSLPQQAPGQPGLPRQPPPRPKRAPSLTGQEAPPPDSTPAQQGQRQPGEGGGGPDDTMANLKKTFAGIFGDM